jgi:hypothetical protein
MQFCAVLTDQHLHRMPVSTAPTPHTPVPTERTTVKGHDNIHTKTTTPALMAGNNGNSNAVTNHKLLINSTGAQELRQAASAGNVALVKELCKKSVPFDADIVREVMTIFVFIHFDKYLDN